MTLLLALWAGAALEARLLRAEALHSSLRVVFARLARAVLLVAAVLVVLPLIGVDLTVLSVFGGALGVGLGLGLQKIASNYLSGFIILLDRSIRLGDMITVDGHYGEVTRITTRYMVVRTLTGVEAIIPNDTLVTSTVLNHSYTDKRVRLAVRVQVAYGTDVPEALELLIDVARRHPRVLARTGADRAGRATGRQRHRPRAGLLDRGSGAGQPERPFRRQRGDFARVPGPRDRNSLSATGG